MKFFQNNSCDQKCENRWTLMLSVLSALASISFVAWLQAGL
jgi:hypothetical protein